LHVPEYVELSDDEVKRRARVLYGKKKYRIFETSWKLWEEKGQGFRIEEQLDQFRARMYDLSEFMKTFKQRLSIYYNAHHNRVSAGSLWKERFKSVLVEESEHTLLTVAAYIDLNPVRAGLVKDPKEYRWSGYAEAVAGSKTMAAGIHKLFNESKISRKEMLAAYRENIYIQGAVRRDASIGKISKPGFNREAVDKVLDEGGELSMMELLHCRVRYFTDGVVIGSKVFVEKSLNKHHGYFSKLRRKRGAKQMKSGDWGGLCAACELRNRIIST